MKVGDTVPVTLAGHTVTQARVTEMGEGTATLRFEGQIVVMGVRTEFDLPNQDTAPVGDEHQVLGLETENGTVDTPIVGSDNGPADAGQDNNNEPASGETVGNGDASRVPVADAGNVSTVDSEGGSGGAEDAN